MASTSTSPNNVAVKFRGRKEREMKKPVVAAPKQVKPAKPSTAMRKRARGAMKRGLISESAMKKHMGEAY